MNSTLPARARLLQIVHPLSLCLNYLIEEAHWVVLLPKF